MTVVALPLFRLDLSYLVRHGRRWTALEHLLLWAVAQDARSLADACSGTDMPTRLVVEALVNLLKVGWIELTTVGRGTGTAVLFTANARGRAVLAYDELPYAYDLERRFAVLYVDRMTAHVLKEDQILIRHADQIDRSSVVFLQSGRDKYDASPARFFDGLRLRPDDHFERPLDHRVSSLAHHAILDVVGEHVGGLPDDAPAQLSEVILRQMPMAHWSASTVAGAARLPAARALTAHDRFGQIEMAAEDLLIGGREHKAEFRRVLREARSVVYVHSTFLGAVIEAFVPDLIAASERGIDVALLWGERRDPSGEEPNQSEVKGRLAHSKIPVEARERVRLARDPTNSHAKVILADSGPDGAFEAVVGSCNWLSATYMALELSFRLREPRLVREVAGILADMSRPPSGAWGRDVTTLLKVQDKCRLAALVRTTSDRATKAMLVIDDEHYAAVRDVRNAAARSVILGCDLFGPAALTTIFEPLGTAALEDGTVVCVLYNQPTATFADGVDDIVFSCAGTTTKVTRCPGLHGKFLSWDNRTLLVTSFNWLAASVRQGSSSVAELGVLVRDPDMVPSLIRRVLTAANVETSASTTFRTGSDACRNP